MKSLEELQVHEQNLQAILLQKQILQTEMSEIETALEELKNIDYAYKIVGGIMIKKEKDELIKELTDRKKIIELRIKSFEKQEERIRKEIEQIREEILKGKK
jgi:prefoldin beta subunit